MNKRFLSLVGLAAVLAVGVFVGATIPSGALAQGTESAAIGPEAFGVEGASDVGLGMGAPSVLNLDAALLPASAGDLAADLGTDLGADAAVSPDGELFRCRLQCTKEAHKAFRDCMAGGGEPSGCRAEAKAAYEACFEANCSGIEPSCRVGCLIQGRQTFRTCMKDGGGFRSCLREAREAVKACMSDCNGDG